MAEGRTPEGWLSACRMSGKKYMFLEGTSDERFWKIFIDRNVILPQQVNGWKNVVACVRKFNENGEEDKCIGIIDKDFEGIFPHKNIEEDNIFWTDNHDIELMMYDSPAWEHALAAINKHNNSIPSHDVILKDVYKVTDQIGYLKLSSLKHNLNLQFKHQNKDKVIELPKYEKLLHDKKQNFDYKGDDNMIDYLYMYSLQLKGKDNIVSKDKIKEKFTKEKSTEYPSCELSNGHDVTYILTYVLKKKYLPKHENLILDLVETSIYAAYNHNLLQQTRLYGALQAWATSKNLNIFVF